MFLPLFALFVLISNVGALFGIGRDQYVTVTGQLICNGMPASGVKVKLYDTEATFDDLLDEKTTDSNGQFKVSGHATEITNIDPKVNLYHKCNYGGLCYKKVEISIPSNYITSSGSQNPYNIGTINLANQFSGDSTDCLN